MSGQRPDSFAMIHRNVNVDGHRTSMRLEPYMWDALEDIAQREGLSVSRICTMIKSRLCSRPGASDETVSLTSAIRVFIAAYFRRACMQHPAPYSRGFAEDGDFMKGTPFEGVFSDAPSAPYDVPPARG